MTIDQLKDQLKRIEWFANIGKPLNDSRCVQIFGLESGAVPLNSEERNQHIADQMMWLPSSRDEADPIYGKSLEERLRNGSKDDEVTRQSLDVYKTALTSLRRFEGHPAFQMGAHDFSEAARGGALYAVRRTVLEAFLGAPEFWSSVFDYYCQGHWPCGILPNRTIVVF